jgi:hypothetical protein
MSDVVVSVTESTTTVAVTENSVNVAVTEVPVAVSTSSVGLQGATGAQGIGYTGVTSTSNITIGSGLKTFTLTSGYAGAFITGMRIRAIHSDTPTYYLEGAANYVGDSTLIITVDKFNGSGSHNSWFFAVAGEVGQTGAAGSAGAQGASGVISVNSPITNTGSASSAVLGLDQSVLSLTRSQISDFTSGTVAYSTASGTANTAGTAYFATTAGTATYATTAGTAVTAGTASYATLAGTAVSISGSITRSQVSDYAAGTVAHGTADPFLTGDNSFTGQNTFTPTSASSTALRIVGQPSQGAILQDWRSSSASLVSIAADGALTLPSASITASGVASFAQTTTTTNNSAVVALIARGASGQSANLQEWQNSGGTAVAGINSAGRGFINSSTFSSSAYFKVAGNNPVVAQLELQAGSNQTANLFTGLTQAGGILGGRNAVGQIFTGSTTGLTTAVGGATTAATSAAGTATITTTSAHNIGSGDLVVVAGITPGGFNGTYVVTAVPSATAISYVNATSGPQTVAGTISVYAQTTIVARSAATTGAVVRGATSQASNLQEWQNNAGSILAAVRSDGKFKISTNNIATTVGATGTASALPALPVGYFQIEIGGVVYKTPYYNN